MGTRLAWRAGLERAARIGTIVTGPALACIAAAWWFGWELLGPLAAAAGVAVTLGAAAAAWRRSGRLAEAAVVADRALGLPGLLTTATTGTVGARPAGFAAAVGARAAAALEGRHAGQVVSLGRTVIREGGIALVLLSLVAASAALPTAAASQQAAAAGARLDRAAALLELARSVEAGGDNALAEAIRRAGRSLAAPDADRGGVPDPGALTAAQQQVTQRQRSAAQAREALDALEAGDLQAAAEAAPPGSAASEALAAAAKEPAGSAARAAALESAIAELEPHAATARGTAGLLLEEAAARLRTARPRPAGPGTPTATREPAGAATPDTPGGADAGGSGRRPQPPDAPDLAAKLAAAAPRVLARPLWDPADDPIVKRYFETAEDDDQ
ncbi:MAG: hypothetical protein ACYTGX_04610 [Planctomycetota bacterium]